MNTNHLKKLATAQRLIKKHGRLITLVAKVEGDGPKWQGSSSEFMLPEMRAVFVPFQGGGLGEKIETVSLLKAVSSVCLIAPPTDVDVTTASVLIDTDGNRYGIEWHEVLKPADVVILVGLGVNR